MHDASKVKSTLDIIDRHGIHKYKTLDNHNKDSISKGGTSIIFLDTENITDITSLYCDNTDLPQWLNLEEPNASSGKIQIASFKYSDQTFYIANIYAPSTSNKDVKISFFNHLKELLALDRFSQLKQGNTIIVGDWNIVEKPSRDVIKIDGDVNDNSPNYLASLTAFLDFTATHNLTDLLVHLFEDEDELSQNEDNDKETQLNTITFRHKDNNYFARLDRAYVNTTIINKVQQVSTPPILISDHLPIKILIYPHDNPPPDVQFGKDIFKISKDVITDYNIKKKVDGILRACLYNSTGNASNHDYPYSLNWEKAKSQTHTLYKEATKKLYREIKEMEKKYDSIVNEKSQHTLLEKQNAKEEYELLMNQKHLTNKASSYAYTHNQDERMNREFFKKQQKRKRARSAITPILKQDHLIPTPDNIVKWEDNPKGLCMNR